MEDSIEKSLKEVSGLESAAETVSRGIHDAVLKGGEPTRQIADALHGKWLGHPLHPALTDFVVGAFAFGSLFNLAGGEMNRKIAKSLIAAGAITAVPTALAGATDFSTVPKRALNTAAVHGALNSTALLLYLMSLRGGNGEPSTGSRIWSTLGFGVMFVSAWLGGKMTYNYKVGVNKAERPDGPGEWEPVLSADELTVREPKRVEFNGTSILLYKRGRKVYAIGAVCAHEGGPLEEGEFFEKEPEGLCVECPWHQSVYAMQDGSVVHGPSTYDVAGYEARVRNGQVEIRLAQPVPEEEEDSRQMVGELMTEE